MTVRLIIKHKQKNKQKNQVNVHHSGCISAGQHSNNLRKEAVNQSGGFAFYIPESFEEFMKKENMITGKFILFLPY